MRKNFTMKKGLMEDFSDLKKNVDKVTILEPCDKKILANLEGNCNIYQKLVLFLKLDTQAYYNLRLILGLESH